MNTNTTDYKPLMDFVAIPVLLFLLVLAGNASLLVGHKFLVDQDHVKMYLTEVRNAETGGWRPDEGLGNSSFFADPGVYHVWSLFRWWHELFDDNKLAYDLTILFLIWAGAVALFFLLKEASPRLGRLPWFLLSALIAFSSLSYEFILLRHHAPMIIAASVIPLILVRFFKQPKVKHYLAYTLLLFFVLFAGSTQSLLQTLIFSVAVFFVYSHYHGWLGDGAKFLLELRRYFLLNLISGMSMALLGAWIFYSIFIESQLVGYVRDPAYINNSFFNSADVIFTLSNISKYFLAGLFSPWLTGLGIQQFLPIDTAGWSMVSPVMPVILLVTLFYKSRNFWEFSGKYIVFGFLFYIELVTWAPGVWEIFQSILNLYPIVKFHPFIQVFEVVLFASLLDQLQDQEKLNLLSRLKVIRGLCVFLFFIYAGLFLSTLLLVWAPELVESLLMGAWNFLSTFTTSKSVLTLVPIFISENTHLFNEVIGISSILFYGATCGVFFILMRRQGLDFLRVRGGVAFAGVILINNLLLSWAVYPLNGDPLIWEEHSTKNPNLAGVLKPTDRYIRVGLAPCRRSSNYAQCIQNKFINADYGALRHRAGYTLFPALEFSSNKTFSSKETENLVVSFLAREGIEVHDGHLFGKNAGGQGNYHFPPNGKDGPKESITPGSGVLRLLSFEPSFISSRLYNFTAVNYYMSQFPLPVTKHLEPVYSGKQFYLYKNKNAWPYYYFADRIESISSYEDLYNAKQGTAYLWHDEEIEFTPRSPDRQKKLELMKFEYGDVEFQYESEEQEFLVMADAWHPNWRAQVDGNEIDVIKVNGVFKGALLPAGKHKVHFFFDNSSYFPGIWISVVAWVVFLSAWIMMPKLGFQSSKENSPS